MQKFNASLSERLIDLDKELFKLPNFRITNLDDDAEF